MYPPVTNLLHVLARRDDMDVHVFSSPNQKGLRSFELSNVQIVRHNFGQTSHFRLIRLLYAFFWHLRVGLLLRRLKPKVVMSVEPHSAIAVYFYTLLNKNNARILIHHHEYYSPADYRRQGNRFTWLNRQFENRLLKDAVWVSQTNADRLRLFRHDHPNLTDLQCHVLPNYPPRRWQQKIKATRSWPRTSGGPLRLIYVGSVSLCDTYIGALVDWLLSSENTYCTLDVYCYNLDSSTRRFLEARVGERLQFHCEGVAYDELPMLLAQYDVGLILYRCRTVNFVFNASNKLFEYLSCGLDVWYPPCMLGVKSYATTERAPRVIETNFEELSDLNWDIRRCRLGVPYLAWTQSCEDVLSDLVDTVLTCSQGANPEA